jgi:hypothetical protein
VQSGQDKQLSPRKREEHLSTNGKWRSFPKVPHLLQYIISGNYFGKVKINGKTTRKSLQTTVWSTAQLRLNDFLKEHRENRSRLGANPSSCFPSQRRTGRRPRRICFQKTLRWGLRRLSDCDWGS